MDEKLTTDVIQQHIRIQREAEVFPIVNRGQFWFNTLTEKQIKELEQWYKDWLEATKTMKIPKKPKWLKD